MRLAGPNIGRRLQLRIVEGRWCIVDDVHTQLRTLQIPLYVNPGQPKLVILVRHGETISNATNNYDLLDGKLTERGREQAQRLRPNLQAIHDALRASPAHSSIYYLRNGIELAILSPLSRATETGLIALNKVSPQVCNFRILLI